MLNRFKYKLGGLMGKITEQSTRFYKQQTEKIIKMKYLIVLIIAVPAVIAVKSKCSYENLQSCFTLESIIGEENWPQEIDDVNSVGEMLQRGLACLEDFNYRCFNNPATEFIPTFISYGLSDFYNNNFIDGKNEFLNRTKQCYNKPSVASKLLDINKRFVGLVEKLVTYRKKTQLPIYCCAALYLDHGVTSLPVEDCKQIHQDQLGLDLKSIFQTPFKEICSGESDYLHCINKKLNDEQKSEFLNIINADPPVYTKHYSVLPTLYEAMGNY